MVVVEALGLKQSGESSAATARPWALQEQKLLDVLGILPSRHLSHEGGEALVHILSLDHGFFSEKAADFSVVENWFSSEGICPIAGDPKVRGRMGLAHIDNWISSEIFVIWSVHCGDRRTADRLLLATGAGTSGSTPRCNG